MENGFFRAFRHADGAVNAFVGVDHKKVRADSETVDRAHSHAGRISTVNAGFTNNVSHGFLPNLKYFLLILKF